MNLELLDLNNQQHLQFMFQTRCHPKVVSNLLGKPPSSMEQHCSWLKEHLNVTHFIYLLKDESITEQWVGYCQCIPNEKKKEIEVGWVIHPTYHSKGYGKLAVSLFLDFVKSKYSDWNTMLEVKDSNKAAISIYERNGFHNTDIIKSSDGSIMYRMRLINN